MPYKEHVIEKRYWKIGEIAKELGIKTSTIHFWERFGLISPDRREQGNSFSIRLFNVQTVQRIYNIKLMRDWGISNKRIKLAMKGRYIDSILKFITAVNKDKV